MNLSHLLNFTTFSLASLGWYFVTISYSNDSILSIIYLSAAIATIVIYISSLIFKNVSLYDTYWGLQGALYVFSYWHLSGQEIIRNKRLLFSSLLTIFWSLRLTMLFVMYSWGDIWNEDWRYATIRKKTGDTLKFSIRSLIKYYFIPMNIGFFGHIPYWYIINSKQALNWIDLTGLGLILTGILMETIADYQLRLYVFKAKVNTSLTKTGTDEKLCMNHGLWSLCRHPNYFGDFLYWLGLYVVGLGAGAKLQEPFYILTFFIGTVLLYLVFNYVSIPFMEKRQLQRRQELYEQYIQQVPFEFFPFNFLNYFNLMAKNMKKTI